MSKNKILIALNPSQHSQEIIPSVEKFFPAAENELKLFFISQPPSPAGLGEPDLAAGYVPLPGDKSVKSTLHPIYASQQEDSIKAHVEAELAPVMKRLDDAGYKVSLKVGFDKNPVDRILRVIRQREIDLVAMSTRASVGVTRFFFRSIADRLASQAQIPVLLIHPAEN